MGGSSSTAAVALPEIPPQHAFGAEGPSVQVTPEPVIGEDGKPVVGADGKIEVTIPAWGRGGPTGGLDPLYTKAGKACCWQDSNDYAFRLKQLQLINYAIGVLSRDLYQTSITNVPFKNTIEESMNYKNKVGSTEPGYEWSILSNDPTYDAFGESFNVFTKFSTYIEDHGGASSDQQKRDLEGFLIKFTATRATLLEKMFNECATK
jgi:hypothetical protein